MGKVVNQVGLVNVDIAVFDDAFKALYSDGVFHGTSNWMIHNLYRNFPCDISSCICKVKKYVGRWKPKLCLLRNNQWILICQLTVCPYICWKSVSKAQNRLKEDDNHIWMAAEVKGTTQ